MGWSRFFRRHHWDEERSRELQSYLDIETQENVARGMSPKEARYAAQRKLGNTTLIREEIYRMNSLGWLETLWQDLRYALRVLAKTPGFTAVVVVTLTLGIGVNTAVFSLLYDTVLERLPIRRPQELVQLTWLQGANWGSSFNWPEYRPLLEPEPALPGLFAYLIREANFQVGNLSERVRVQLVSGAYYSTLGVTPLAGRSLNAEDDRPGAAPVAVLAYAYWQRRFSLDPSVLGRTVYLDGTSFTIVGVTPPGFHGLNRLLPPDISYSLQAVQLPPGRSYYVYYFTRLESSLSLEQARTQVSARFRGLLNEELKPERSWMGSIKLDVVSASTGEDNVRFELREPLRVLGISVGVVLLICCTNIASLLMGRASARSHEIGVRLALGASQWRIIRQLLTESVVLGGGGGGLGLLTGFWVHRLLTALLAIDRSTAIQFRLHMPLLVFTVAVSLFTGILFGLVPALRATRLDLYVAIRGEAPVAGRLRLGPTRTLLIVQVAASIVLLLVATLFVRTLRNLERVDAGFNRDHLLLLTIDPRESRFQGDHVAALFDDLMERIPTIGGVRSAALALIVLFGQSANKNVWVQGVTQNSGAVAFNFVGPGFFSTAGIPLLMGREFSPRDRAGASLVAIVNEAFAREYFPGQNPVGRRFGDQGPSSAGKYEIVGVVKDSRYTSLRQKPYPAIIQALWQFPQQFEPQPFVLHVRTMGDAALIASSLLREIQAIDMGLVVYDVRTMADQVNGSLRQERMFAMLSALFGALALGLCCVGLYGLASYSVVRRTREIGLRMALGAVRRDILWLVLREALTLVSIGVVMGIPVALASTRLVQSLLFGLTPADPSSLTMAMLMLAGVATFAALLPACRASRIDPMCALRHE